MFQKIFSILIIFTSFSPPKEFSYPAFPLLSKRTLLYERSFNFLLIMDRLSSKAYNQQLYNRQKLAYQACMVQIKLDSFDENDIREQRVIERSLMLVVDLNPDDSMVLIDQISAARLQQLLVNPSEEAQDMVTTIINKDSSIRAKDIAVYIGTSTFFTIRTQELVQLKALWCHRLQALLHDMVKLLLIHRDDATYVHQLRQSCIWLLRIGKTVPIDLKFDDFYRIIWLIPNLLFEENNRIRNSFVKQNIQEWYDLLHFVCFCNPMTDAMQQSADADSDKINRILDSFLTKTPKLDSKAAQVMIEPKITCVRDILVKIWAD